MSKTAPIVTNGSTTTSSGKIAAGSTSTLRGRGSSFVSSRSAMGMCTAAPTEEIAQQQQQQQQVGVAALAAAAPGENWSGNRTAVPFMCPPRKCHAPELDLRADLAVRRGQ